MPVRLQQHMTYEIQGEEARTARAFPVLRQFTGSSEFNTLDYRPPALILEMEDQSFHHDSAVPLPLIRTAQQPHAPVEPLDSGGMEDVRPHHPWVYEAFHAREISLPFSDWYFEHRRGLVVLAVAYYFLQHNAAYRLLLAGHTDTTGSESHNFSLSDRRAESVDCLLRGNRDRWTEIAVKDHCVMDYQLILTYFSRTFGWPCDPGGVDGDHGDLTDQAVRQFQETYNKLFGQSIAVDGEVGWQTWGAVFDVYLSDLASLLDVEVYELGRFRQHLCSVDGENCWIGCGERIPIAEPERDNYRSKENRRVELLFFHESNLPDLGAHLPGGSIRSGDAGREASGVYAPGAYEYLRLDPHWWFGQPIFRSSNGAHKFYFFDPAQDRDVSALYEENPLSVAEPSADDFPYVTLPPQE